MKEDYLFILPESAPIKDFSSHLVHCPTKFVRVLKRNQYQVSLSKISGDAPKDLIRVYEYGRCRKKNQRTWIRYIAKVGHKRYPSESITEHLITRLGQVWGFRMAGSKLMQISGQLRFCSEFFRKPTEQLIHGADILSRYLKEDNSELIETIDKEGWSQELLHLDFVKEAIQHVFPTQYEDILHELTEMLLFDAIVGNNDRHFFNWGILVDLKSRAQPRFSPIYDSARGLFWNFSDKKIVSLYKDRPKLLKNITDYHKTTSPKIGLHPHKKISHLHMAEHLLVYDHCNYDHLKTLLSDTNLRKAFDVIDIEFGQLLTESRRNLIKEFLSFRFEAFSKHLK